MKTQLCPSPHTTQIPPPFPASHRHPELCSGLRVQRPDPQALCCRPPSTYQMTRGAQGQLPSCHTGKPVKVPPRKVSVSGWPNCQVAASRGGGGVMQGLPSGLGRWAGGEAATRRRRPVAVLRDPVRVGVRPRRVLAAPADAPGHRPAGRHGVWRGVAGMGQ